MSNFQHKNVFRIISVLILLGSIFACSEEKPRKHSATQNVKVLEKQFTIASLNRNRTIRLYLPPDYQTGNTRYPVLYMHDGQNLFDDVTSYVGEWGVDETLNQLYQQKGMALIVVGIDNGAEKRMSELTPWENSDIEAVEGEQYMDFIVKQLKPYIDSHYRTLNDVENTAIMGSSMGGLISHYAIFQYPDVFSKAGIFSPSFWVSDERIPFSRVEKLSNDARLYYLVGGQEGDDVWERVEQMEKQLLAQGLNPPQIKSKLVANGEHNEKFWRSEFAEAILWLFRP